MPAYKYQLKTGKTKWYANFYYEDWTGTRQHKCKRGFDTKKEANEYERLFLDKFSKSPTILFSSLVDNYLDDMKTRIKPTTIKNKEYLIRTKLVPYFGKLQICAIDAEVIRKWQNVLIEYRDKKGKPYAETYLYTINAQLSAIMNYAVKFYRLQINPCFIAGYIGKNKASEMKIWTHDQFKQALEHEKKIAYTIAFKILFYGGIREGELLALTPDDIPRDEAMIDINKNYAVVDRVEYFLTPKTERSVRIVTIPDTLHAEILEYIDRIEVDHDERIFYFGKSGLSDEFKRMKKLASAEDIRIHDLRHSHVAMLINMGVGIEEISRRLGHDSIKTTWDTYSHLYPGTDKVLAGKIEDLIKKEIEEKDVPKYDIAKSDVPMVPDSPLGKESQAILFTAEKQSNVHIQKNNRNIFQKYGIDIDNEILFGYKMMAYLDFIAFGNSIINIITDFHPEEKLKDFILSMFTESISACEMADGNIMNLDTYISQTAIPRYHKIYGIYA